jgi:hypothetical protein
MVICMATPILIDQRTASTQVEPIINRNLVRDDVRPFDWQGVRPVYRALHAQFWRLTEPFSLPITDDLSRDLAVQIAAMDAVDEELDELSDEVIRRRFCFQVEGVLLADDQGAVPSEFGPQLTRRLKDLREVLLRRGIERPFTRIVSEIFALSERKRESRSLAGFLEIVEREWELAGRLPLLIMGEYSNPRFESFILRVCCTMHLVDTLLDARQDYQAGLLSVRPGLWFACSLMLRLLGRVPSLLLRFPRPLCLIRYAFAMARATATD